MEEMCEEGKRQERIAGAGGTVAPEKEEAGGEGQVRPVLSGTCETNKLE